MCLDNFIAKCYRCLKANFSPNTNGKFTNRGLKTHTHTHAHAHVRISFTRSIQCQASRAEVQLKGSLSLMIVSLPGLCRHAEEVIQSFKTAVLEQGLCHFHTCSFKELPKCDSFQTIHCVTRSINCFIPLFQKKRFRRGVFSHLMVR